jgi:alkylation response protein AidB-like acyl-CoA dehydrogenase
MDVRLSPEQRALRDSVAQVVDRLGPGAVGQLDDDERAAKLASAVAGTGWRELRVPADDGTPLASAVEVSIVAAELSRGLADAAFLGPTLAAELRRLAGAPAAEAPETVALAPGLGALTRAEDGSVPAGALAVDAAGATAALVLVPAPDGVTLGLVPVTVPAGEASATVTAVDLTRPGVRLAAAPVAPVDGQTRVITGDDIDRWTALGLAVTAAELVGSMRGALDLARDYAGERRQYGKAIGSFQAVQHLLADALVATEGSRSISLHAAWAVDALPPAEALAAGAMAKAYAARAARTVCETAIQVHGGIGNTWECLAHVHLRRAFLSSDVLGGAGANLARVLDHHAIGDSSGLR